MTKTASTEPKTIFVTHGTLDAPNTSVAELVSTGLTWITTRITTARVSDDARKRGQKDTVKTVRLPVFKDTDNSAGIAVSRLQSANPKVNEFDYLSYGETAEQSEQRYAQILTCLKARLAKRAEDVSAARSRVAEAKKKIAVILDEYNLSIDAGCGDSSDMHGVHDEHMILHDRTTNTEHRVCDGWSIEACDLR